MVAGRVRTSVTARVTARVRVRVRVGGCACDTFYIGVVFALEKGAAGLLLYYYSTGEGMRCRWKYTGWGICVHLLCFCCSIIDK